MIERAFMRFSGPARSGKTTLLERVLERSEQLLTVMRCECLDEEGLEEELDSAHDPELRRYRQAGADIVARYRFGSDLPDDAVFYTDAVGQFSEGVIFEGDSPLGHGTDLEVFVLRPLPPGESLLRRGPLPKPDRPAWSSELEAVLRQELAGLGLPVHDRMLEIFRRQMDGPPARAEGWVLWPPARELARAEAVAINIHSEEERARAEALAAEVRRIREDPEVAEDVIPIGGSRRAITIRVADLSDPTAKETRDLLKRILRPLKS